MPTALKYPTSKNAVQKTLDSALLAGNTSSMTLDSVVGIQNKAGVCVIDRVDSNGTATPLKREYVSFTGVSGLTLTGLTRNADGGGSDQDHAVGAVVEFVSDVLQEQAIIDALLNTTTDAGSLDTTKVVDLTTSQTLTNKVLTSPTITTKVEPTTNDGAPLGSTSKQFSDLFLAEGGVINWDNGDATLTQVGNVVTLDGADLKIVTPGTAATSVATIDGTQTLTNKRVTPRVVTATNYTTDTGTSLNCDTTDIFIVTAQAGALKFNNPTGTPTDGQKLWIAVTGTAARALTYDTQFEASDGVALPTTTVTTKRLDIGFVWRADTSKWHCVASA